MQNSVAQLKGFLPAQTIAEARTCSKVSAMRDPVSADSLSAISDEQAMWRVQTRDDEAAFAELVAQDG